MILNISHDLLPKRPTTRSAIVMDHFGIDFETGRHVIADNLLLPVQLGNVVLFSGPSGSGKSSLLRAAATEMNVPPATADQHPACSPAAVCDIDHLPLGEQVLIDALPLPVEKSLRLLSACGLGEPPNQLSDGQRYRFRLALALAQQPRAIIADEFTATLDRTLAQVIALSIRRLADRTGTTFLLATTHDDVARDLDPDVHVRCALDGPVTVQASKRHRETDVPRSPGRRPISFADELTITTGTRADWPRFARWHYRSSNLGMTRLITLLRHREVPIGICVFCTPPLSLRSRNRYFGHSGRWDRTSLRTLNRQLVMLSRVVLHPTYRGAGLAASFVRESCQMCGYRFVEALTEMGHLNPFFEKAGFVRVGSTRAATQSRSGHSVIYGARRGSARGQVSEETYRKSQHARPVYYVWHRDKSWQSRERRDQSQEPGNSTTSLTGDHVLPERRNPHTESGD